MDQPDYFIVNPLQIKLSIYPDKNHPLYRSKNNKVKSNPMVKKRFQEWLNELRDIALLLDEVKQSIDNRYSGYLHA